MSLRSPLGRVLGLGSAKGGSGHWYSQRTDGGRARRSSGSGSSPRSRCSGRARSHEAVAHWLASPFSAAMAVLLVLVGAYHALLGLQVVVEDYVGDKGTRVVVLVAIKFALVVAGLIGVLAVLRLAFGVQA